MENQSSDLPDSELREALEDCLKEKTELQDAELKFRAVAQTANDAIITTDSRDIIVTWNSGAESIFGYTAEEAIGRPLTILIPERYRKAHQAGIKRVSSTGEKRVIGHTVELFGLHKTGREFPVELSLASWEIDDNVYFSAIIRNITERKRAEEALKEAKEKAEKARAILQKLSMFDSLTDIPNRRHFDEFFLMEWRRAVRIPKPLSVVMIDIDYFKEFNDFYGHQAGDKCLQHIASVLRQVAKRTDDMAARYGGEEFVMVLPGAGAEDAMRLAEKAKTGVAGLKIPHAKSGGAGHVTISLGVATRIPDRGVAHTTLIEEADKAMYRSKKAGKNRVTAWDSAAQAD
jgi:diguanylate cyclase (GGDEF)-like protein/PAS domain S-box-containing protein